jgi:cell division protein FtsI/penicillin-binding protein 2
MQMVAQDRNELSLVKRRMEAAFLLFLLLIGVLTVRLAFIQWYSASAFARLAERMQGRTFEIEARRGRIEDRNGMPLAIDTLAKAILVNPKAVGDANTTATRIASVLNLPEKDREAMRDLKLRRGVNRQLAESLLTLSTGKIISPAKRGKPAKSIPPDAALRGLWLEDTPVRANPSGSDGIQLVGPVNIDGEGLEGIEKKYDPVLRGRNGERQVRVDAAGRPVPDAGDRTKPPVDGKNVRMTVDRDIQHLVETEIAKVAELQMPDSAIGIVMDVKTGEVLGMASYPSPKAGDKKFDPKQRKNRAITDLFEPGSIFKVITAAAALETGVNTNCYCSGSRTIGNRTIHCAHGEVHGAVDLRKMIEMSCNIAAGTISERIGPKRMHHYLSLFGFNDKTGIEFPGEEHGHLLPPDKWRAMRTANIGFGQGVVVTPIQILAAYAAIANDGVYNPPTLIKDGGGLPLPKREPHRVITSSNAAALRSHMEAVVTGGTGKAAKVAGYSVAGKTGTAQIASSHGYIHGAYVASFCGFTPASKPRLAILVSVWHPRRGQYGGTVSAPVFREIARHCLDYLGVQPDVPGDLRDGSNPASMAKRVVGKRDPD